MTIDREIWIVEECSNPSTEYYILPALKAIGFQNNIKILNSPPIERLTRKIYIIIVRYLTRDWVDFIEVNKKFIEKIIYFMDDDLFDIKSWFGLPINYLKKIYSKAYKWKKWLIKNGAEFLFSTDFLVNKYYYLNPFKIPPYPIFENISINDQEKTENIKVFYHGTSSHLRELKWLKEIIKSTIRANNKIVFEIFGNDTIKKNFRNLTNVIIIHPMKWNSYKKFLIGEKRDIGLVPILPYKFNLARSYTKFFEIGACGSVGIFSQESLYSQLVSNGIDGILLPNKKEKWIESILKLATDDSYRLKLNFNFESKMKILAEKTRNYYIENLIWRFK